MKYISIKVTRFGHVVYEHCLGKDNSVELLCHDGWVYGEPPMLILYPTLKQARENPLAADNKGERDAVPLVARVIETDPAVHEMISIHCTRQQGAEIRRRLAIFYACYRNLSVIEWH